MKVRELLDLARRVIRAGSLAGASRELEAFARTFPREEQTKRGTWAETALRLSRSLVGRENRARFSIFKKGNAKLPFYSFSSLPVIDCPGAGACAGKTDDGIRLDSIGYCYSFRGWRNVSPFFRQLQNSIFLRYAPERVAKAFRKLRHGVVVRLYVDGDFYGESCAKFWFRELRNRSDIRAYGYSKSWDILYSVRNAWPSNYILNLSSGGMRQKTTAQQMRRLKGVRGHFIAVPIGKGWRDAGRTGNVGTEERFGVEGAPRSELPQSAKRYHLAVREAARIALPVMGLDGAKIFSCPGYCGPCMMGSHACGSPRMRDVVIAIGIH